MAMELTWLGQGGYLLKAGGVTICIDPYLSLQCETTLPGHTRIAPPPMDVKTIEADLFVFTHDHMDHLDEWTVRGIDFAANLFAGPASCRAHLAALGVPKERILALDRMDSLEFGDLSLIGVYAEHTEDSIGLVARDQSTALYFTGDTLYSEKLAAVAGPLRIDILVTCINGRWGNMGAAEAALVAKQVGARVAIPSHYGMFEQNTADPADFAAALAADPENKIKCAYLEMYVPCAIE